MAQLRDTLIQGSARVTDTLYANTLNTNNFETRLLKLDTVLDAPLHINLYNSSNSQVGAINYFIGGSTNVTAGQYSFYQYSPKSTPATSTTGFYEQYSLPNVTTGLAQNKTYNILTSKTAVTVNQGGTGAYSVQDARANLGTAPYIQSVFYGTCETAQSTQAKQVILINSEGFSLETGTVVFVRFTNAAAASTMTMAISADNGTTYCDAKSLYLYATTAMSSGTTTTGWRAGALICFVYTGTAWQRIFWENTTYSYMRPYETTGKGSYNSQGENPVKTGSAGWKFQLSAGKYFMYTSQYDNLAASALTLNIGSTGAKPIYINGQPSSASNYTLPGGQYLVYYDGTNYHFRTDNYMPGNISGTADNVRSTVAVAQGGTGNTSFTENCVIVGNGANSLVSKGLKVTDSNGNITLQPNVSGKAMTINFSDTANIAYNPLNGCIEIIA